MISTKLVITTMIFVSRVDGFLESLPLLPYSAQLMYSLWILHRSHIYDCPPLSIRSQGNKIAKDEIWDFFCPLSKAPKKVSHVKSLKIHLND